MPAPHICFFDDDLARKNLCKGIVPLGYARLSFDEDGMNYCSIQNQKDIIAGYCKERFGAAPQAFFEDDGVSGYSFDRPHFSHLLAAIEAGRGNLIVAKDLSRIGRHNALTQLFVEECERCGIRVVAIDDYDSHNPSDELTLGIRTWSNERAVKDASRKVQAVVNHKQEAGTWFCAAPFGYRVLSYEQGLVEIDQAAAETVRRVYRMYDQGLGYKAISIQLTQEGVPTPSRHAYNQALENGKPYKRAVGDTWRVGTLCKMLADDFYIGVLRTNKYDRMGINGRDVRTPRQAQHVFENHHPPLIDRQLFERVQARREGKKATHDRGTKKYQNIYSGHIRCGDCGFPMYAIQRKDLAQQYVCGKWFQYGKAFCSTHTIKAAVLDGIAMNYLRLVQERGQSVLSALNADVRKLAAASAARQGPSLQQLQNELEQAVLEIRSIEAQRVKQIMRNPQDEEIINDTYDALAQDALARKKALEEQRRQMEDLGASVKENARKLKTAMDVIDQMVQTGQLTKGDIGCIFDTITVYEDGRVAVRLNADLSCLELDNMPVTDKVKHAPARQYQVIGEAAQLSRISGTGLLPGCAGSF